VNEIKVLRKKINKYLLFKLQD